MKIKCDYCRQMIDEGLDKCPHCGATITKNRMAGGQPQTIEELKQWYEDHHLPPENITRFFIGKDIKEPKAFGIYKADNGDFVVYKNKANGERAVRYQGVDEGYAVNELYQRLRSEVADQKEHRAEMKAAGLGPNKKKGCNPLAVIASIFGWFLGSMKRAVLGFFIIFFIICIIMAIFDKSPDRGYYKYKGHEYYYQNSNWYTYDKAADVWLEALNQDELNENINSDSCDDYKFEDHEGASFESSSWYDTGSSDDSDDWDSDSTWDDDDDYSYDDSDDYGGWDSGSTDWDSDW